MLGGGIREDKEGEESCVRVLSAIVRGLSRVVLDSAGNTGGDPGTHISIYYNVSPISAHLHVHVGTVCTFVRTAV